MTTIDPMRKAVPVLLLVFAFFLWFAVDQGVRSNSADIEPFVGEFVGRTISSSDSGLSERDLGVTIEAKKNGFVLKWTTTTRPSAGKVKRKSYKIEFTPSNRDYIYSSAMRTDKFGARIPLDPMKGDPYVWAKINGGTMTVHAMMITDDGGYEMQTYERTLTESGMDLTFSRFRDGEQFKLIKGTLLKVEK
jgi:hypothetical protein